MRFVLLLIILLLIMLEILLLGIQNKSNYIVDIGASTGVMSDPVYKYISNSKYSGLCIEGNPNSINQLKSNIAPTFDIYNGYITPNNVIEVFTKYNVPLSPDILKIDIDGYDLEVIRMILTKYKPKIILAEINEKIPPPILFEVIYTPTYQWDYSHCVGFSIASGDKVMKENNYKVVNIHELNNIICISYDMCDVMGIQRESDITDLYKTQYILNNNRFTNLPWNQDVNHWLSIGNTTVLKEEITNYFEKNNNRSQFSVKTKTKGVDFIIDC